MGHDARQTELIHEGERLPAGSDVAATTISEEFFTNVE
jgi:hypothetical protein